MMRPTLVAASGFLGKVNLLSWQAVMVTAVVTQPLRYIAVDRDALRTVLFEDEPLNELLLSTFVARREALQRVEGIGLEIVVRARRKRPCGCSSSLEAPACRSPGVTRTTPTRRCSTQRA